MAATAGIIAAAGGSWPAPVDPDWAAEPPEIPTPLHEILVEYSGIPWEETAEHTLRVLYDNGEHEADEYDGMRLGDYKGVTCSMTYHRLYDAYIVPKLTSMPPSPNDGDEVPIYLELGTGYGQELRALLHRGVSAERLYGVNDRASVMKVGYQLFRDEERLPTSHMIVGDVTFEDDYLPEGFFDQLGLRGRVDILCLVSVFHLFDYDTQVQLGKQILTLMRPGGVVVGCGFGSASAEEHATTDGGTVIRHDLQSWERMWLKDITEDRVIHDATSRVDREEIHLHTEIIQAHRTRMPQGLNIYRKPQTEPDSKRWYWDEDFRWMRFEVWIGRKPPAGLRKADPLSSESAHWPTRLPSRRRTN